MGEVDISGQTGVARQIGVVENVVVEAIASEEVSAIIGAIEAPVVTQSLGAKNQSTIVAQLVILDDSQRLEGFAEPDTVGDDATAEAVELVDGAHNPVALELEKPLPYLGIANAGGRPDDPLFVEFVALDLEQVMQDQRVDAERVAMRREGA